MRLHALLGADVLGVGLWRVASRAVVQLLVGVLVLSAVACSPAPPNIGIDNPDIPALSLAEVSRHRIFIATTRQNSEVVGALFSGLRARELGLASVDVTIPPNHEVGNIERPRSLPPDPRKEFAIVAPTVYASDTEFVAALNTELRKRDPSQRGALFFVHGYNTTTSEAIMRAAQFAEDSGFEGVSVIFTWASAGQVSRYVYDMNSALVARPHLIDAAQIVSRSIATDYHIFAHSMGGFLTMEAIRDAALTGQFNRTGRLRNVVLASPDIDIDLFQAQMADIGTDFDRFFVFLSADDYALRVSRIIAGGVPRVGAANADELAALGIDVIDLSEIRNSRSDSHSKFAGSPEVVQLIGMGLRNTSGIAAPNRTVLDDMLGGTPIRVVRSGG
jgi:esterase/lipase superfamily enzyme